MSSPFSKKFLEKGALFMNYETPLAGNAFIKAKVDAEKAGKDSFVVDGKSHPVQMQSPFHKEPAMDPCSAEFDYEVATDAGMTAKQIREARKKCAGKTKPKQNVKQVREDEDQVKAAAARA